VHVEVNVPQWQPDAPVLHIRTWNLLPLVPLGLPYCPWQFMTDAPHSVDHPRHHSFRPAVGVGTCKLDSLLHRLHKLGACT
jgi:hypothetical protein